LITSSHSLANSNTEYRASFNCTPDNVAYGNYTHLASGTTARHGIWEGVKIKQVKYKGEDGVWRNNGTDATVTLTANKNGSTLEVQATYQIWTMGFPGRDYPFFFFGNYGGNKNKYSRGYFTDGSPQEPSNLKSNYAKVPSDWSLVHIGWAHPGGNSKTDNWSYKNAMIAGGTTWNNDSYEYRNGTNSGGGNGWTSDSGNKPQESRKNCFFVFEKTYTASLTSSGIVFNPDVPAITVVAAKGDGGTIKVKHTSPNGLGAYLKVSAWNTRTGTVKDICNFNSWTWVDNNETKDFWIDFNSHFGESERGSDIKYYAWAKTSLGHLSNNQTDGNNIGSAYWKGVHRYNGRPTIPTGLKVTGRNNVFYDQTTLTWNAATDPDGDAIVYDVWIRVVNPSGVTLYDDYVVNGYTGGTSYSYNISEWPDESKITYWVCSSDNLIVSNWSAPVAITKGQAPDSIEKIYPVNNSTVYNKRPRILINTGEDTNNPESVQLVKVKWNNVWYNNKDNSDMFSKKYSTYTDDTVVIFKPTTDAIVGSNTFAVKLNNVYADGPETVITFTLANAPLNATTIAGGTLISAAYTNSLVTIINNVRKAYGLTAYSYGYSITAGIKVDNNHYNNIIKALGEVNTFVNNYDSNTKFDIALTLENKKDYELIKDSDWDKILDSIRLV
jgi:hypothetical protein